MQTTRVTTLCELQGANKIRQAMSIVCHEAAEDIATTLVVAIRDQLTQQDACTGVNHSMHQTKTGPGFVRHEVLLKLPATSVQTVPTIVAAALEQMTINGHVLGPSLSVAWSLGHSLNPLLSISHGLGPAFVQSSQQF